MLLRDGAGVVITAGDVLGPLGLSAAKEEEAHPSRKLPSEGPAGAIVAVLAGGSTHLDGLITATGLDGGVLREELLRLELAGIVSKRPGGFYSLS